MWFRPLCLNRSQGYWMNLLRVRRSGVLGRHLATRRRCTASCSRAAGTISSTTGWPRKGGYVFEPPGETTRWWFPTDVEEMITFFNVNGIMVYVDAYGEPVGFEDVFTKIDMCRDHYAKVGLGADYVDQFIR